MNNKHIVLAGGIIIKDKKILIIKRSSLEKVLPNYWEIASGKKRSNESLKDCLIREVKEEVNINVKPIFPFSVFEYQFIIDKKKTNYIQINYITKASNINDLSLSPEHDDYTWISLKEVNKYKISKEIKRIIKKAFRLINVLNIKEV